MVEEISLALRLALESAAAILLLLAVACLLFAHGLEHIPRAQLAEDAAFREAPGPLNSLHVIHPAVP